MRLIRKHTRHRATAKETSVSREVSFESPDLTAVVALIQDIDAVLK